MLKISLDMIYPKNFFHNILDPNKIGTQRGSNNMEMGGKLTGQILERSKTSLSELKKVQPQSFAQLTK